MKRAPAITESILKPTMTMAATPVWHSS